MQSGRLPIRLHGRLLGAIWLASFSSAAITSLAAAAEQVVASASPAPATTKSTELAPVQLTVQLINEHIRQAWEDQDLAPSPAATDGEWCRRVYLDLIGRVPTVAELRAFMPIASKTSGAGSSIGCWATSTATSTCETGRRSGPTC